MASPAIITSRQCRRSGDCTRPAIIHCVGCFQLFCHAHFVDHRRRLENTMKQLMKHDDHLQELVRERINESSRHPLFEEIDRWEHQSITNIQQKANDLRQQLVQLSSFHFNELSEKLQRLREELRISDEQNSFIESDIQNWTKLLEDYREDLISSSTFNISGLTRNSSLPHILVNIFEKNEFFQHVSNNRVRIEEYGRLAIHDAHSTGEVELRGSNEYRLGRHEIRLRILQPANSWIFLGINSKSTPLQNNSYAARSACGWANNNNIWRDSDAFVNESARIEMAMNDTIILIVDCDNEKIFMINERTNGHYELVVNIDSCPFPWQLHVNLYEMDSSIRILSS